MLSGKLASIIPESKSSPADPGNETDIAPTSPASPEMGCNLPISRPLQGCTDRVLLLVNQNPERSLFSRIVT